MFLLFMLAKTIRLALLAVSAWLSSGEQQSVPLSIC